VTFLRLISYKRNWLYFILLYSNIYITLFQLVCMTTRLGLSPQSFLALVYGISIILRRSISLLWSFSLLVRPDLAVEYLTYMIPSLIAEDKSCFSIVNVIGCILTYCTTTLITIILNGLTTYELLIFRIRMIILCAVTKNWVEGLSVVPLITRNIPYDWFPIVEEYTEQSNIPYY